MALCLTMHYSVCLEPKQVRIKLQANRVSLLYLSLEDNRLHGSLPSSWSSQRRLRVVKLASNSFSGTVPSTWSNWSDVSENVCLLLLPCMQWTVTTCCFMQVLFLSLADNQLSGSVPYMPKLVVLDMSSNHLTEPNFDAVPATLQILYLANNRLTGLLPVTLGYTNLTLLDLAYNNLSGPVPPDLPQKLSILNMSNNAIVGSLPSSWSSLQNMAELRLDNNRLTGTLPPAWSAWGSHTSNSVRLSITNSSLHGRMSRQ